MRPIYIAEMDKPRPVLILTRSVVRPHMTGVTVAVITTRIRGLSTEVAVGPANGLSEASVVNCDNIRTIATHQLREKVGALLDAQEPALSAAITAAFDLD